MAGKINRGFHRIKKLFHSSSNNPQPARRASTSVISFTSSHPVAENLNPSDVLSAVLQDQESPGGIQCSGRAAALPAPLAEQNVKHTGWAELELFIGLLIKGGSVFGPLKQAAEGIMICVETYESVAKGREDYENLRIKLNTLFHDLAGYFGGSTPPVMTSSIVNLAQGIEREIRVVRQKQQRSGIDQYMKAREDADEVLECYRRIQGLLERLALNANMNIWKTIDEQATETRLGGLPNSPAAKYNSVGASALRRGGCTENTRTQVLEQLRDWAYDDNSQKIYWLNGMAGTGKTTIAYSLCEQLEGVQKLAASFFCSRQLPACRDVNRIVSTISYQLSRFSRPFRYAVSRVIEQDPDIHNRPLLEQLKQLVEEPLNQIKDTLPFGLVIVIDALDECDDKEGVHKILDALLSRAQVLPIKFFVTSRPDAKILDRMREQERERVLVELRLHDLERSTVREDIKTYLTTKLKSRMNLPEVDLNTLIERSGVLFIYAATVTRYVGSDNFSRSAKRLREVLSVSGGSSSGSDKEIDALYTAILKAAFDDPTLTSSDLDEMRLILHTVICAREPLSVETIAGLLNLDGGASVQAALRPLLSVLQVSDVAHNVTTLHESFPNYLLDQPRCNVFYCNAREHNARMAQLCFDQINIPDPPFNICNLESSYVFDDDIPDLQARVERAISKELFYACRYWDAHMILAETSQDLASALFDFASQRLLLWMEVMNLKKCIYDGAKMLSRVQKWSQGAKCLDKSVQDLIRDARMFTTSFSSSPVSLSTPHIYVSALSFWPSHAPIAKYYPQKSPYLITRASTAMSARRTTPLAVINAGWMICCLAYSTDGACFASGAYDGTICIRDASTGHILGQPLEGHNNAVRSVAYSPDSGYIVSGSSDATIRVWNVRTGQAVGHPLKGHTLSVNSVAYSPGGIYIASGSDDASIRIWGTHTGQTIGNSLEGHAGPVNSIAYSPNGAYIISGSSDNTVRIWDAHTGQAIGWPLEGHTDNVWSVTYSPDGGYVASGSRDDTIHIWDALTGEAIGQPLRGHTDSINSVAYSPGGAHILSASDDNTVRIWDAHTGQAIGRPLEAHHHAVHSVAYSPDGAYFVSGSFDTTMCIWDTRASQSAEHLLECHSKSVLSLAYLPDGARIVSGSADHTLRIWDVRNGCAIGQPLEGHSDSVSSVACSPNSAFIASGSWDHTIRIWDAHTGQEIGQPLKGHSSAVSSISYSPEGAYIASCSKDSETVYIWDICAGHVIGKLHYPWVTSVAYSSDASLVACGTYSGVIYILHTETGQPMGQPLEGHNGIISSIAYSPHGAQVASGSWDGTIRIWDTYTRQAIGNPLEGHTSAVNSVVYSPNGAHLVSGSDDKTLRIWDAHTGKAIGKPLEGHTDAVRSLAYSPGGVDIVSGSNDNTIRVWDVQSILAISGSFELEDNQAQVTACSHDSLPSEARFADSHICNPGCRADGPHKAWALKKDGWVVVDDSKLLVWIPPDLRGVLLLPQNTAVLSQYGFLRLDFNHKRIGDHWHDHFQPQKPIIL